MGHRANYIIKEKGATTTYYTHWRGNWIAKDLLIGPEDFIDFVKEFEVVDHIVQYPWIQGFVYIDVDKKEMKFNEMTWLSYTSVKRSYMELIREKWEGWKVDYAQEGLNLIGEKVDENYINSHPVDYSEVENVKFEERPGLMFKTCVINVDESGKPSVFYFNTDHVGILFVGDKIFDIMKNRPPAKIDRENESEALHAIYINQQEKYIALSEGMPRFKEEVAVRWPKYKVEIVELGYLHLLEKAGIDTTKIKMTKEEVLAAFTKMKEEDDDFDPSIIVATLFKGMEDGMNPHFLENIKPTGPGEKAPS